MGCNFDLSDIDFHGYATKNDVVCADGRIIRHDVFAENDGADELRNKNLNKSAEEMQQSQQKEPTEQTKKDEVSKSDERLA